jgi:ketosteroid isomerase-like protein
MSEENVEIVRGLYEEWWAGLERDDPGVVFDSQAVADDAEFTVEGAEFSEGAGASILREPDGYVRTVWRGREAYVQWFRAWTGEFENWSLQVERLIDAGDDRVVALTHQSATGKGSGVPVEMKVGAVWELKDGRVVRLRSYPTYAEALEAAGLSE